MVDLMVHVQRETKIKHKRWGILLREQMKNVGDFLISALPLNEEV